MFPVLIYLWFSITVSFIYSWRIPNKNILLLIKVMKYSKFPLSVILSMYDKSLFYYQCPNVDFILFMLLSPSGIAISLF